MIRKAVKCHYANGLFFLESYIFEELKEFGWDNLDVKV